MLFCPHFEQVSRAERLSHWQNFVSLHNILMIARDLHFRQMSGWRYIHIYLHRNSITIAHFCPDNRNDLASVKYHIYTQARTHTHTQRGHSIPQWKKRTYWVWNSLTHATNGEYGCGTSVHAVKGEWVWHHGTCGNGWVWCLTRVWVVTGEYRCGTRVCAVKGEWVWQHGTCGNVKGLTIG